MYPRNGQVNTFGGNIYFAGDGTKQQIKKVLANIPFSPIPPEFFFFRRFSGHTLRCALFVYRLIGATLIRIFFAKRCHMGTLGGKGLNIIFYALISLLTAREPDAHVKRCKLIKQRKLMIFLPIIQILKTYHSLLVANNEL